MNIRDLRNLKPGTPLRMKRGWGADGAIMYVVEYPCEGDIRMVKVRDGRHEYIWTTDIFTLATKKKI